MKRKVITSDGNANTQWELGSFKYFGVREINPWMTTWMQFWKPFVGEVSSNWEGSVAVREAQEDDVLTMCRQPPAKFFITLLPSGAAGLLVH